MDPVTNRQVTAGLAFFGAMMVGLFGVCWILGGLFGLLFS